MVQDVTVKVLMDAVEGAKVGIREVGPVTVADGA